MPIRDGIFIGFVVISPACDADWLQKRYVVGVFQQNRLQQLRVQWKNQQLGKVVLQEITKSFGGGWLLLVLRTWQGCSLMSFPRWQASTPWIESLQCSSGSELRSSFDVCLLLGGSGSFKAPASAGAYQ